MAEAEEESVFFDCALLRSALPPPFVARAISPLDALRSSSLESKFIFRITTAILQIKMKSGVS